MAGPDLDVVVGGGTDYATPDRTAVDRIGDPAHDARACVYAARAAGEAATMPRGIFNHTAASSRERRRDRLAQE